MGDIVFGILVTLLYAAIIHGLIKTFRRLKSFCSGCQSCPMMKHMPYSGKIDLLALAEAFNKEEHNEHSKTD